MGRWVLIGMIVIAFTTARGVQSGPSPTQPTPVEIWRGGDDGLTLKLEDALEASFKSSSDFILSSGKKPGTLIVTLPTNVAWRQFGKRTKVLYTVDFSSAKDQKLGTQKGSCWDDDLRKCAADIVNDARIEVRKIH